MPQMVFFVLSVQRILPGRVQHGQLLPVTLDTIAM